MSRPDEGLIHQWLDGECTPEESARLEQLVATDSEWATAVAEARGLIAASSRIVQSLDAVPRAMPGGSVASPRFAAARAPQRFATKLWMRIAAAVVLVAGTAYVLREQATEPFVPTASIDTSSNVPFIGPERVAEVDARKAPSTSPALPVSSVPTVLPPAPQPLPSAGASVGASVGASAGVGTRSVEEQRTRAAEDIRGRAPNLETQRRASLAAEAPRGAIARTEDAPSAAPARAATLVYLDGCWRVSAPPQLVGILERPALQRQSGDTLVLITSIGDLKVVRDNDVLRGGLQAVLVSCSGTP